MFSIFHNDKRPNTKDVLISLDDAFSTKIIKWFQDKKGNLENMSRNNF